MKEMKEKCVRNVRITYSFLLNTYFTDLWNLDFEKYIKTDIHRKLGAIIFVIVIMINDATVLRLFHHKAAHDGRELNIFSSTISQDYTPLFHRTTMVKAKQKTIGSERYEYKMPAYKFNGFFLVGPHTNYVYLKNLFGLVLRKLSRGKVFSIEVRHLTDNKLNKWLNTAYNNNKQSVLAYTTNLERKLKSMSSICMAQTFWVMSPMRRLWKNQR